MSKSGFSLAAAAKASMGEAVSRLDIDTEVLKIPAAKIDVNSANFYEQSDLDALAASIELTGLMHPPIVKEQDGRYVLIDGERRFRAMTQELGWETVPCIVRKPASSVIEELMLIEANRQQRKMSAGDLSKQAERYTELLAELKRSGVEIPGRLRKAVAEALQVSESKLARLAAIRKNLIPTLLGEFDSGRLSETAAYELQMLPAQRQTDIAALDDFSAPDFRADDVAAVCRRLDKMQEFGRINFETLDKVIDGRSPDMEHNTTICWAMDELKIKDGMSFDDIYKRLDRACFHHSSAVGGGCRLKCERKQIILDDFLKCERRFPVKKFAELCVLMLEERRRLREDDGRSESVSSPDTGDGWHRTETDGKPDAKDVMEKILLTLDNRGRPHLLNTTTNFEEYYKVMPEWCVLWRLLDLPEEETDE